jgi:DNA-binding transcriptional ArsR family regulator
LSGRLNAIEGEPRAGAQVMSLAADPVNREILLAMTNRVLEMDGREYTVSNEGREALFVAAVIERWLGQAPDGPIEYGSTLAKRTVAALVEGWSAAVIHALAREPMTSAELDEAVDGLDRRQLQRHLVAMRGVGLLEAVGEGGEALYAMTDWLRSGIAPLIASARLERGKNVEGANPVDGFDVEAGFRMALGLVELPEELSGVCRLRLNLDKGRDDRLSGVTAVLERGQVVCCEAGFERKADAWALAGLDAWLDTVIDLDAEAVSTGGDAWLTGALVRAIHAALFG